LRARELAAHLKGLTVNLNLQVLEGSKVVEVKNSGVNKGRAAMRWLSEGEPEFVLAVGDDWTDEDLFKALSENAWTIKVGLSGTAAKFNLGTPTKVLALLHELLQHDEGTERA
jgi:trehalose 6-phosphate synthase/phosphatase